MSVLIQRDVYLISPQDKHSRLVRRELREEAIAKLVARARRKQTAGCAPAAARQRGSATKAREKVQ